MDANKKEFNQLIKEIKRRRYQYCGKTSLLARVTGLSSNKIKKIERLEYTPTLDEFDAYCGGVLKVVLSSDDLSLA